MRGALPKKGERSTNRLQGTQISSAGSMSSIVYYRFFPFADRPRAKPAGETNSTHAAAARHRMELQLLTHKQIKNKTNDRKKDAKP